VVYSDDCKVYRVTTEKERTDSPNKLFVEMNWMEQAMISKGDEVMLLYHVKAIKKGLGKVQYELESMIWFGAPSNYVGMKENTVEEKFRCVPSAPVPPPRETFKTRDRAMYEKEEKEMEFQKRVEAAKKRARNL